MLFLTVIRKDRDFEGPITINTHYIVNVRPFNSGNRDGLQDGAQINLSTGEVYKVTASVEEINSVIQAQQVGK